MICLEKPRVSPPKEEKESTDKPSEPVQMPTPSPQEEQAEAVKEVDPVKAQKFFDGSCLNKEN